MFGCPGDATRRLAKDCRGMPLGRPNDPPQIFSHQRLTKPTQLRIERPKREVRKLKAGRHLLKIEDWCLDWQEIDAKFGFVTKHRALMVGAVVLPDTECFAEGFPAVVSRWAWRRRARQ